MTFHQQVLRPQPDLPLLVRRAGDGSPVLVLHGGAGPASVAPIAEHLADRHHVLVPTHPGWDDTPRPDRLRSVSALADSYLDLLAALNTPATVIGSSFGGWVAAEMALRDPADRVGQLVLLGAIGPPPAASSPPAATPAGRGPGPAGLTLLQHYTGPTMWDVDLPDRLADVDIPVLVLWGEQDHVVPPVYGRAYADAFPNVRFAVIPEAGHLPASDAPDAAFALLDPFLDASSHPVRTTP